MLGSSRMVNQDQIRDCLSRGWVVISPNHRLCPQVNVLEGPMQDCRDLLSWIYDGSLSQALGDQQQRVNLDLDRVYATGTSSGGTLALALVSPTYDSGKQRGAEREVTSNCARSLTTPLGLRRSKACSSNLLYVWSL